MTIHPSMSVCCISAQFHFWYVNTDTDVRIFQLSELD